MGTCIVPTTLFLTAEQIKHEVDKKPRLLFEARHTCVEIEMSTLSCVERKAFAV